MRLMTVLLAAYLASCSSAKPEAAPAPSTLSQLETELGKIGDSVSAFVQSVEDKDSVQDPKTFRGQLKNNEKVLRERLSWVRDSLNRLFPEATSGGSRSETAPIVETERADTGKANESKKEQLFEELEQRQSQLDKITESLDQVADSIEQSE